MKRTVLIIMSVTIISKVFGLLRDLILAYFYGASNISDAYLISLTVPSVLFSLIAAGIYTGYIPMYSKIESENGHLEGLKFTNNLINLILVVCTLIVITGLLFTEQIVKVFASGFEGETLKIAIRFTRVSMLSIYFTGLVYVFSGFLQLKKKYVITSTIGLPLNFIVILSFLISTKTSIYVLTLGFNIAVISQLLFLLIFAFKNGYKYKFIISLKNEKIRKMITISIPVIIGSLLTHINMLVERTMASNITIGGISALTYASTLNGFVLGVVVSSIDTVLFPTISSLSAKNEIGQVKETLLRAISNINLLIVPATVGILVLSQPIVNLLFARGEFTEDAVLMTSSMFFYYGIGLLATALTTILKGTFYSIQATKIPMVISAVTIVLNICLNLLLSKTMGLGGLALAASISSICGMIIFFVWLMRKIGSLGLRKVLPSFFKIMVASIIMGSFVTLIYDAFAEFFGMNLALVISVFFGVTVYFLIAILLKIEEVHFISNRCRNFYERIKSVLLQGS